MTVTAKAPAKSAFVRIEFRLFGSGTLWADDVTLTAGEATPPPPSQSLPKISGSPREGQTLTTTFGSGGSGASILWLRCDASGAGCTNEPSPYDGLYSTGSPGATTYLVTAADVGSTIRSEVSPSGGGAARRSDPTAVVTATPGVPVNTALPTITGSAPPDVAFTASAGTWTNAAALVYQWVDCGSGIASPRCGAFAGATSATLQLSFDSDDQYLRVLVTATNAAGSVQALSGLWRYHAPLNVFEQPAVRGTPTVGSTLVASIGRVTGAQPVEAGTGVLWKRCNSSGSSCDDVASGPAGTRYTVTSADVGSTLRAAVVYRTYQTGDLLQLVTPPTPVVTG